MQMKKDNKNPYRYLYADELEGRASSGETD